MNKVTLYIKDTYDEYQMVDLFDDETISVTSKIQDIKDVSKVFTDFSQSFTLPASKTNNKIFAHFYNYFLDGQIETDGTQVGVFDARSKKDAIIEINYIPFRKGKMVLNGVKMKENKPYAYNITFYGNTVSLKDLFSDDKLQVLDWLNNFNHSWDDTTVKDGFTTGLSTTIGSSTKTNAIIYPLITPTKRLFYDSSNNNSSTLTGNIAYDAGGGGAHIRGVDYTDLKPAVKLEYIIEAIEDKYGIEFTDDFFGSSSTNVLDGLYMWLSREKGKLPDANPESILNNFTYSSGDLLSDFYPSGSVYFENSGDLTNSNLNLTKYRSFYYFGAQTYYNDFQFTVFVTPDVASSSQSYSVKMIDTLNNNEVLQETSNLTGNSTIAFLLSGREDSSSRQYSIQFIITSDTSFSSSQEVAITERIKQLPTGATYESFTSVYEADDIDTSVDIAITERMPDIKVYDFMTGLFKMFNLTAYYVDDVADADFGKIRVLPLDDFYDDDPQLFDITKYVDSSETNIDATIPFSEIEFKYEDPKTLLMLQHKEKFNEIFGDSEYAPQDVDRGKPYKVDLPFEHLKFERLEDEDTGNLTPYQWGYSAGDNFKPTEGTSSAPPTGDYDSVLTAPILFYGIRRVGLGSTPLSWVEGSNHYDLISYWMPSNASEVVSGTAIKSGTATATSAFRLINTSDSFAFFGVYAGDVVYNTTDNTQTTVVSGISLTEIELADDIFVSGDDYEIFRVPDFTLNFDIEVDEYSRNNYGKSTNSLFKVFYETYITDAFNPKKRIFKLTAHLPNSILLNYRLNDRFQIGDKVFTINSIDTNLKTGESKLELLNVL
jgi:hypothetical protein